MTDIENIKKHLSPCGINCGKCFAFSAGDIKKHSMALKENLGNFDVYAQRFVELLNEPVFTKYPEFKEMLRYFSNVNCGGCRQEKCKFFKNCRVRDCSERKGVDFCFQCAEFPCNNTGFDENLRKRSVEINKKMKEVGVNVYYESIKDKPRY